MQMKFGVHRVKESQTATAEPVVLWQQLIASGQNNPKHDIYIQIPSSGSAAGIRVTCSTHTHTHTHAHTHRHTLAVTWDQLRHVMLLTKLRESYFKLCSCIRMERFLQPAITDLLLTLKSPSFLFFFPFNFFF